MWPYLQSTPIVLLGSREVPALAVDDSDVVEGWRVRWACCDSSAIVLKAVFQAAVQLQLSACASMLLVSVTIGTPL